MWLWELPAGSSQGFLIAIPFSKASAQEGHMAVVTAWTKSMFPTYAKLCSGVVWARAWQQNFSLHSLPMQVTQLPQAFSLPPVPVAGWQ